MQKVKFEEEHKFSSKVYPLARFWPPPEEYLAAFEWCSAENSGQY